MQEAELDSSDYSFNPEAAADAVDQTRNARNDHDNPLLIALRDATKETPPNCSVGEASRMGSGAGGLGVRPSKSERDIAPWSSLVGNHLSVID